LTQLIVLPAKPSRLEHWAPCFTRGNRQVNAWLQLRIAGLNLRRLLTLGLTCPVIS
jgi:hypothetical protein